MSLRGLGTFIGRILRGETAKDFEFVTIKKAELEPSLKKYSKSLALTESEYKTVKEKDISRLLESADMGRFIKFRGKPYGYNDEARMLESTIRIMYGNVAMGVTTVELVKDERTTINFIMTPDKSVKFVSPVSKAVLPQEPLSVSAISL